MSKKTMLGDVEKNVVDMGYKVDVRYLRYSNGEPYSCQANIQNKLGVIVGEGASYCHVKDNFWKKKGRHMAICRAAKEAGIL